MPLLLDISRLCLGSGHDSQGHYLYLFDNCCPNEPTFVGGVRYQCHADHIECKNMVSDGYGPTLLILLAQEACRLGLRGVAADSNKNSAEALTLVAKMSANPPTGIAVTRTEILKHTDQRLNVLFSASGEVVDERKARRRFLTHQGKGWRGRVFSFLHPVEGVPALWRRPDRILQFMKADYLRRSDEAFH